MSGPCNHLRSYRPIRSSGGHESTASAGEAGWLEPGYYRIGTGLLWSL